MRTFGMYCAAIASIVIVGGCSRGAPPPVIAPTFATLPETALIYYDNSGGIQDSLRLVIREPAEFGEIWERATSTQSSPPPLPPVDFEREMVVVAAAGRMTPADLIRVDSVSIREERIAGADSEQVMDVIVHTVRGCQEFTSDAYPLAILRVQRFDGRVRFTERRERAEGCVAAMLLPSPRVAFDS